MKTMKTMKTQDIGRDKVVQEMPLLVWRRKEERKSRHNARQETRELRWMVGEVE